MFGLAIPAFWTAAGVALAAFFVTSISFVLQSWRSDPLVAAMSPVLILGRALSIGAGVIKALPKTFGANPILPEYKKS